VPSAAKAVFKAMQSYRNAEALRHPKTGLRQREDESISSQRRGKPRLYGKAQAFRWGSISRKAGALDERSSS
jgi:hypothetical protein